MQKSKSPRRIFEQVYTLDLERWLKVNLIEAKKIVGNQPTGL
jgi:hypothetical protein